MFVSSQTTECKLRHDGKIIWIAPWWLSAVSVKNPVSSMLADGTWTKQKISKVNIK